MPIGAEVDEALWYGTERDTKEHGKHVEIFFTGRKF